MEGVGARLGRSSTRYGPATVFSGPVRKWKKTWVPLSSSSNTTTTTNSNANGGGSHLLLYKWTPIPPSQPKEASTPSSAAAAAEPPRRKYKYIPVSVIEEQKIESAVKSSEENKPSDADPSARAVQTVSPDEKSEVKDTIMEEIQASEKDLSPASEAPETNLDLSLGLKAHEQDSDNDPKFMQHDENAPPGEDIEMRTATNSEVKNKTKRKAATPDLEMRIHVNDEGRRWNCHEGDPSCCTEPLKAFPSYAIIPC